MRACFPLTVGITRHRRIRVIFEPEVVDKLVTWDVRFWPSPTKTNRGAVSEPSGERVEHCCRVNGQKRTRCLPKQHRRNDGTGGRQRRLSGGRYKAASRHCTAAKTWVLSKHFRPFVFHNSTARRRRRSICFIREPGTRRAGNTRESRLRMRRSSK